MNNNLKNIALLEMGESHIECIYSQILILKSRYNVFLICNPKLKEFVVGYSDLQDIQFIDCTTVIFRTWFKHYLQKNNIRKVIINTASGKLVRRLMFSFLFSSVKFFGMLHNTRSLSHSICQKFINLKINKYFILADYLYKQLNAREKKRVSVFYPIYFPMLDKSKIMPKSSDFWIVIPGALDFKRRNYLGFINEVIDKPINPAIRFIILGKADQSSKDFMYLKSKVEVAGLLANFIFFDKYLSNYEFYSYLYNADLILPLINTTTQGRKHNYTNYQASGTFNLSFGFQVPMLIESQFVNYNEFRELSFSYSKGELITEINELMEFSGKRLKRKELIKTYPRFDFESQRNSFLSFIE